ncbi:MAG TPA: O-antigen ligase family protein [Woeseiaceae bacterium]|nr:O-antigen ligase family protein [Woeseiaceae bacterium]
MNISVAQYAQMIVAAIGGIAFFLVLFRLPEKRSLAFLIILIPFQVIYTRYGSLNEILIYVAAGTYLLQGRLSRLPFLGPILLVLFVYLLAFTQSYPAARIYHVIYMIGFFSNILLFYMVYNYILRTGDWRLIVKCLLFVNLLVVGYCAIQFFAGSNRVTFFGINEFSLIPPRKDGRLVGPFNATAATAEYLTFQCLFIACLLYYRQKSKFRWAAIALITLNFLFLIATGNRGGFVTLVLATLLFLLAYRRELGMARVVKLLTAGATLFTAMAIVLVSFTEYGMLFERLEGTEIEEGVPDTRSLVWPLAWAEIVKKPILGHGPKLAISTRFEQVGSIEYVRFPHNLLLHILYTTGIVGVFAWVVFFSTLAMRLFKVRRAPVDDRELATLPRVGLLVLVVFFVSQLRIEFLRESLLDYQNYLFVLFGFFLATSDLIVAQVTQPLASRGFGKSRKPDSDQQIRSPA